MKYKKIKINMAESSPTQLKLKTDYSGLTGAQKTVLMSAWTFFKPNQVENSIKVIIRYKAFYSI